MKPIAILHEHPDWFRPLFTELDKRGVPYQRLDAAEHRYDPQETSVPWSLVFNRASPSAYLRGRIQSTFHTLHWLRHLERIGVPVMNVLESLVTDPGELRFCAAFLYRRTSLLQRSPGLGQRRALLSQRGGHLWHFQLGDGLSRSHVVAEIDVNRLEVARDFCIDHHLFIGGQVSREVDSIGQIAPLRFRG